jgi:hypothetical protein
VHETEIGKLPVNPSYPLTVLVTVRLPGLAVRMLFVVTSTVVVDEVIVTVAEGLKVGVPNV